MIIAQETAPDVFKQLSGGTIVDVNGTQHPWAIVDTWTDEELQAIHIYRVQEAPIPKGRTVVSWTIERVAGVVQQVIVLGDLKTDLKFYNAAMRYDVEIGGQITVDDISLKTDRETQTMLAHCNDFAVNPATQAPPSGGGTTIAWKGPEGFLELTTDQIMEMYKKINTFVEQCFTVELDIQKQIDAGTITTADQIDGVWNGVRSQKLDLKLG
jgi:hypothetical protein